MMEFLKEYKNFLVELGGSGYKATELYAVDEEGNFTQLIPDGLNEIGRPKFIRVCLVHVDTLSSNVRVDELRKIAQDLAPKAPADKGFNISHTVYAFVIDKMIGQFRSRRVNGDIFLFFNGKKFNENEIKFRMWKIVGGLLIKKADRIVESTREKIKKDPYGYLDRVVKWFKRIGEKMYRLGVKNIKKKSGAIRQGNYNINTTSINSTSAHKDNRRSQVVNSSLVNEVVKEVEGTILRKLFSIRVPNPEEVVMSVAKTLSLRAKEFARVYYVMSIASAKLDPP